MWGMWTHDVCGEKSGQPHMWGYGHMMYVEGSEYEQAEIYESHLQVKKTGLKHSP